MSKFIFITGGVVSSLGKGLAAASLAALLQARGYKVKLKKFDPYLNVDPGTMNPFQHGEVFVTEDGAETDLDLGHYERFTATNASKFDSITTGKIYSELLQRERRGDYLGATVQIIPHVSDLIKEFIVKDSQQYDFVICEIGGTVGDIEAQPYCESIRQLGYELGKERCAFIHLTLIPYLKSAGELKTKPTQHSVKELRSIGIQPDILLCRSEKEVPESEKIKIANFCNVKLENVIEALDIKSIYSAPTSYHEAGLDTRLLSLFADIQAPEPDLTQWQEIVHKEENSHKNFTIAVIGKYTKLIDAYKSVKESIIHAAINNNAVADIKWINSHNLKSNNIDKKLENIDAIIVPGGFGKDGLEGKLAAIKFARENNIPFLGICYGMQLAVIEFARNVCGLENAGTTEIDPDCEPIVDLMRAWENKGKIESRSKDSNLGGTMRLGSYETQIKHGSLAYKIYQSDIIHERHRHRYEVNINYQSMLAEKGLIFSGMSPEGDLPEIAEIPSNKFFISVQFHPEFKSRPFKPHPLFDNLVKAALGE